MREIITSVDAWLAAGEEIALATVVSTWGSSPRGVGAKLAIRADMTMAGSVSGGCVENAVIEAALETLTSGKAQLLDFGVSDDDAWEVGLTCGGRISVFVEPLDAIWWQMARAAALADDTLTTLTALSGPVIGAKALRLADGGVRHKPGAETTAALFQQAELADGGPARRLQLEGHDVLVDVIRPRPRLIIVGGVHVAIPLVALAEQLGFRVALVDPRAVFANSERFPNVETIEQRYPEQSLAAIGLDANSYVAVLTHDPKIDDGALRAALPSAAPYVGVLSSRRTHAKRLERLRAAGLSEGQLARIRTPIGLDIGARQPEEIALAIMAEIIAARNGALSDGSAS